MPEVSPLPAIPTAIELPAGLLGDVGWLVRVGPETSLTLRVPGVATSLEAEF